MNFFISRFSIFFIICTLSSCTGINNLPDQYIAYGIAHTTNHISYANVTTRSLSGESIDSTLTDVNGLFSIKVLKNYPTIIKISNGTLMDGKPNDDIIYIWANGKDKTYYANYITNLLYKLINSEADQDYEKSKNILKNSLGLPSGFDIYSGPFTNRAYFDSIKFKSISSTNNGVDSFSSYIAQSISNDHNSKFEFKGLSLTSDTFEFSDIGVGIAKGALGKIGGELMGNFLEAIGLNDSTNNELNKIQSELIQQQKAILALSSKIDNLRREMLQQNFERNYNTFENEVTSSHNEAWLKLIRILEKKDPLVQSNPVAYINQFYNIMCRLSKIEASNSSQLEKITDYLIADNSKGLIEQVTQIRFTDKKYWSYEDSSAINDFVSYIKYQMGTYYLMKYVYLKYGVPANYYSTNNCPDSDHDLEIISRVSAPNSALQDLSATYLQLIDSINQSMPRAIDKNVVVDINNQLMFYIVPSKDVTNNNYFFLDPSRPSQFMNRFINGECSYWFSGVRDWNNGCVWDLFQSDPQYKTFMTEGWRLPTYNELRSIFTDTSGNYIQDPNIYIRSMGWPKTYSDYNFSIPIAINPSLSSPKEPWSGNDTYYYQFSSQRNIINHPVTICEPGDLWQEYYYIHGLHNYTIYDWFNPTTIDTSYIYNSFYNPNTHYASCINSANISDFSNFKVQIIPVRSLDNNEKYWCTTKTRSGSAPFSKSCAQ